MTFSATARRLLARPSVRMLVPVIVLLLCFCAVLSHVVAEGRRATLDRAGEVADSLVAALSSDISRNIETLDLSLQAVVDNQKYPGIDKIDPALRQLVLFDRSATARHLGTILVLDETGDLRIDSRTLTPEKLNFADRDYFKVHKDSDSVTTYVGRPEQARLSGKWFIGVSRRLSHPDGSFAGVVVASLRLSFFEELFRNAALGPNGNITLARTDGTLIMRWPYRQSYVGLDLSKSALYTHLAHSRAGLFETDAATDGVHRLIAYSQIGDLPLVIGVGQSTDDIYLNWRRDTFSVIVLVSLLCLMTVILTIYLARELARRETAEKSLAALATSDGLTGLSNRRYFDQILDREWRRCMREALPAAVMMIDADYFKSYNDNNGHLAGDALLKALGASIAGCVVRASDLGARYGGDEFAILLGGAALGEAEEIAKLLRQRFAESCSNNNVTATGLSIGIAAAIPRAGEHPDKLIQAADQCLYIAKRRGRGRTVVASKAFETDGLAA